MNQHTGNPQVADTIIQQVADHFRRAYLAGIPLLHNDTGAFLSFICCLTAIESLGAHMKPSGGNAERFKTVVQTYYAEPLRSQADHLWDLRNAMVHVCVPAKYALIHHRRDLHLTTDQQGATVLNAEDFYDAVAQASERYFSAVASDAQLRSAFIQCLENDGVPVVKPITY